MISASRSHLRATGETYFQHLRFAALVGVMAIGAGLACLIHAIVPALCQRTCSATVALLQRLFGDREALDEVSAAASGPVTFVGLLALSSIVSLPLLLISGGWLSWLIATAALAIPATFLLSNPDLSPVQTLD